ncbi:MAG: proline racemase family protein [Pseudomonadota bacterium]
MERIAIIGTGIAGMGCARKLHPHADLTLYERERWIGGHTNTVEVKAENEAAHSSAKKTDGEVDRSPTGTGVSGRLALLRAREQIAVGETIGIESILGSRFYCQIVEEHDHAGGLGPQIVPQVEGRAWVTGATQWVIDPEDPFRAGFLLR